MQIPDVWEGRVKAGPILTDPMGTCAWLDQHEFWRMDSQHAWNDPAVSGMPREIKGMPWNAPKSPKLTNQWTWERDTLLWPIPRSRKFLSSRICVQPARWISFWWICQRVRLDNMATTTAMPTAWVAIAVRSLISTPLWCKGSLQRGMHEASNIDESSSQRQLSCVKLCDINGAIESCAPREVISFRARRSVNSKMIPPFISISVPGSIAWGNEHTRFASHKS